MFRDSNPDPKRLISAVRNFQAGVLLLFKHKLATMSRGTDESLIKERVVPVVKGKRVVWIGKGKRTVDFDQITKRFESLGIQIDVKRVKMVQDYRNDIEHYHAATSPVVARQYVTDCFVIVRDFIQQHLAKDPRRVLGEETWKFLLAQQQVYEAERKTCTDALNRLKWPGSASRLWVEAATCDVCGSDLIRPVPPLDSNAEDSKFGCASCGRKWSFEDLLTRNGSPHDAHVHYADGGEQVVGQCPSCGNEGYDSIEQECAFCGVAGPYECARCSNTIPVSELSSLNSTLCGYCAHMSGKDD